MVPWASTTQSTFTLRTEPHKWGATQNVSSTREHMETSRLNIVFQGIKVEDGARICTPNFEVFYQKEEINKSRINFKKSSTSLEKDTCHKQTSNKWTHCNADFRGEQRDSHIYKDLIRKLCEQTSVAWFVLHWPSVWSLWLITQHTRQLPASPNPQHSSPPHAERGKMFDLSSRSRTRE